MSTDTTRTRIPVSAGGPFLSECFPGAELSTTAVLTSTVPGLGRRQRVIFDPYNRRLKLYDLTPPQFESLPVAHLQPESSYDATLFGKLTVYARPGQEGRWAALGMRHEAVIKGFFADRADAHIWVYYTEPARADHPRDRQHDGVVVLAESKQPGEWSLPAEYQSEIATEADARDIAGMMMDAFSDYPTPINSSTIAEQIRTKANLFRVVRSLSGRPVAVASAEIDHELRTVEMTDCVTIPEGRGRGLMVGLLQQLERDVAERYQMADFYTLARADEIGMNCVFAKLGYEYTGRLVNNCRMPNGWESVNVWCRNVARTEQ